MRESISDGKAAYSSVSLPVLFSSSSSSAAACKEIARSLPRSELGSITLRTLGSIGSHEGPTRFMTINKEDAPQIYPSVPIYIQRGQKGPFHFSVSKPSALETKKRHNDHVKLLRKHSVCPLMRGSRAGVQERRKEMHSMHSVNKNGAAYRTRRIITGKLNKHRTNHSLIYRLYSEPGSPAGTALFRTDYRP